jgi:NADH-quinone oxidoreductase subunit L
MLNWIWLVPVLPLAGFLLISLGGGRISKSAAGLTGTLSVAASFVVALSVILQLPDEPVTVQLFHWFSAGTLSVDISFLLDPLSSVMLLIVTGVGFLIHVYSIGYMHDDPAFNRFFSYLNLFVFFMLMLVLGSNYMVLFLGWEGVGLCSYLLIGFWFKNPEYNKAASKAFIMNRIGDLAFLLGIILMFVRFGSVSFADVFPGASSIPDDQPVIIAITLLLFIGATGKSAQLPLYTWLPDAMAGPTPVSALIHAATMVTAGIYMVVRSNILYSIAPTTLEIMAVVGTVTGLFAATIALRQNDIKKILAYSTVSQLGMMVAALGVGAYSTAIFHVTTHAFFKALLFLGAGSVIHAMGGEQDIRRMGGLKKKLPVTFAVFLVGTLAITGIPPFAGFFSKDEILAHMWVQNKLLFVLLFLTAVCTAMYMFRLFFLTFYGNFRGTHDQEHHLHESPRVMTVPLIVLATLSVFGGFIGIPEALGGHHFLREHLSPMMSFPGSLLNEEPGHSFEYAFMAVMIAVTLLVLFVVRRKTLTSAVSVNDDESAMSTIQRLLYRKYYVDEHYEHFIVRPLRAIADFFGKVVESRIIDGAVRAVNSGVQLAGAGAQRLQTGNVGLYVFAMVAGIIAIMAYNLLIR